MSNEIDATVLQTGTGAPRASDLKAVIPRVRAILEAFDQDHQAMGPTVLARRSGLPKTTVIRLCNELCACEFLTRDGTQYRLGTWLFALGQDVTTHRSMRIHAAPFLEDLSRVTAATALLSLPGRKNSLFIEKRLRHDGRGRIVAQVEGRTPLHCVASGKVFLASWPEDALAPYLSSQLTARTPFTCVDPARLRQELNKVTQVGFAVDRQELVVGYGAVAAPVHRDDEVIAAMTVVTPISELNVSRLAPATVLAARGLSRAMTV